MGYINYRDIGRVPVALRVVQHSERMVVSLPSGYLLKR